MITFENKKTTLFSMQAPNELRMDAAEMDKVKTEGMCAAASIQVARSRTLEKTNQLKIKAHVSAGTT